jgi:hypothetical protein
LAQDTNHAFARATQITPLHRQKCQRLSTSRT